MAKKKGDCIKIMLECTEARALGATPSRYATTKNRRTMTGRLELKKYNPYLRRHTLHREVK
jgi:large subunit ribosomal protein L33